VRTERLSRSLHNAHYQTLALVLLLTGCPARTTSDAGSPQADASVADAGEAAAPPTEIVINLVADFPDGGSATVDFGQTVRPIIDPPKALHLTTNIPLRDYRIRVFDSADKVVPSDDSPTDYGNHLEYGIVFVEPLDPGSKYSLLIDAQSGAGVTDPSGRSHPDLRREFATSGEKPKGDKPKPKKKKKK
jgi:hypothetical protein